MHLLNTQQIDHKIKRLAMEVLERNTDENELFVIGLNNKGRELAQRIRTELLKLATSPIHLSVIRLNPAAPLDSPIELEIDPKLLAGKAVLLVDDVANTGRSLFFALQPLMKAVPGKVEIAVLVDRKHKNFPVRVDYVGLELATTFLDNIEVSFGPAGDSVVLN